MYLQDIEKNDYVVPDEKRDRFLFLVRRMEYALLNEYEELYMGLRVVFLKEFGSYRVKLRKNQIWEREGNVVVVVGIKNGFVFYKKKERKKKV